MIPLFNYTRYAIPKYLFVYRTKDLSYIRRSRARIIRLDMFPSVFERLQTGESFFIYFHLHMIEDM